MYVKLTKVIGSHHRKLARISIVENPDKKRSRDLSYFFKVNLTKWNQMGDLVI